MSTIITAKQLEALADIYQTRKTIRFNLLPVSLSHKKTSEDEFKIALGQLIENYKQVVNNFNDTVFSCENEIEILNPRIKINCRWLKVYTKQDFYQNALRLKNKNIDLGEADFLLEIFQEWSKRNWSEEVCTEIEKPGILNEIEELKNQPLNCQKRKADFAYWVHQLQTRNNFPFIHELFENINDEMGGENDERIANTKKILDICEGCLKKIDDYLLPSQSLGQEIERASLNYYTINKESKYYENEIKNKEKTLEEPPTSLRFYKDTNFLKNISKDLPFFIESLNKSIPENAKFIASVGDPNKAENWSLAQAYQILKFYKGKQKSNLMEFVSQKPSFSELQKEKGLSLMKKIKDKRRSNEQVFQDFITLAKEIEQLGTEKFRLDINSENYPQQSIALRKKIKETTQKRNKYFIYNFTEYIDFHKGFDEIAKEFGKINADIKGLKKENIDAERLRSWAVILEKNSQHYLMTIPKKDGKLPEAYREIKSLRSESGENLWTLSVFESLTLRALDKLCFKKIDNTFIKSIEKELRGKCPEYFKRGKFMLKSEFKDGQPPAEFYQAILSLETTESVILVNEYLRDEKRDILLEKKFTSLQNFQSEMEKICYIRKEIKISQATKEHLEQKYDADTYQITSYDLEKERQNPEEHTKIWKRFWNQNKKSGYVTRLNPEMIINYVEQRIGSIKDKGEKEVKRNRRKQAEYILALTITENNDKPKTDMALASKDAVKKDIEKFNTERNLILSNDPYSFYYYGIDRGQKELITLGVFGFENQDIAVSGWDKNGSLISKNYKKPRPVTIEAYELPQEKFLEEIEYTVSNGETRSFDAYKNISLCEHLLVRKDVDSCLDLSCAKLIKGKIVVNGDISTYLQIKKTAAMRYITDGLAQHQFTNVLIQEREGTLCLEEEKRGITTLVELYHFDSRFDNLVDRANLKTELQEHFDKIREENSQGDIYTIEKINHLRDAICANAVGIIVHLLQKYPGLITLEDLDIEHKSREFSKYYGDVGSRIEIAFINKLQTLGLVPPSCKMVIGMQSKKEINQLGIIHYVKTDGTSGDCPHCGQRIDKKTKDTNKWGKHQFKCDNNGKSCGFSTYEDKDHKELDFLKNSDDVATYNIAKLGFESIVV